MHSFIVLGKNEKQLQHAIDTLCTEKIATVDRTHFSFEKSIGIEDIKLIQRNISLSPVKSSQKAYILWHAETLTIPAQNALLKTLEEPPRNTLIILLATQKESLLTTIISRCFIIDETAHDEKNISVIPQDLTSFSYDTNIGERLYIAQLYGKNKDTALAWIESIIQITRKDMVENCSREHTAKIRLLQKTYTYINQTNTSPRLIIEHMLLEK